MDDDSSHWSDSCNNNNNDKGQKRWYHHNRPAAVPAMIKSEWQIHFGSQEKNASNSDINCTNNNNEDNLYFATPKENAYVTDHFFLLMGQLKKGLVSYLDKQKRIQQGGHGGNNNNANTAVKTIIPLG